nr:putative ribonuclease H-like domain-containing protein [Tanacetum cinerariifolium]
MIYDLTYIRDAAFDGKEHDFDAKKPGSEVILSQSRRYRDLSAEFEDCSDNRSNEVNAGGTIVPTVRRNSSNSTNPFSDDGLSYTTASPTYGKSLFIVASQLSDDFDMPELEDITYSDDEIARIEAIRLFLAYASFMGFMVYQMDVKSAFMYGTIEEEVYVYQPSGFEDPDHPDKVYKVVKALYGLHLAPRARKEIFCWCRSREALLKDPDGEDVDVHTYKSMIGSFMYLTSSRPDIMFVDSPFDLVAYSDCDYASASLDRKSTTEGCQFLGCKLISWLCKKQTVVATSSTEAKYVVAASCCAQ